MAIIDALFMTKTAEKTYPLGPHQGTNAPRAESVGRTGEYWCSEVHTKRPRAAWLEVVYYMALHFVIKRDIIFRIE